MVFQYPWKYFNNKLKIASYISTAIIVRIPSFKSFFPCKIYYQAAVG